MGLVTPLYRWSDFLVFKFSYSISCTDRSAFMEACFLAICCRSSDDDTAVSRLAGHVYSDTLSSVNDNFTKKFSFLLALIVL